MSFEEFEYEAAVEQWPAHFDSEAINEASASRGNPRGKIKLSFAHVLQRRTANLEAFTSIDKNYLSAALLKDNSAINDLVNCTDNTHMVHNTQWT